MVDLMYADRTASVNPSPDAICIVLPEAADAACKALRALRRQAGGGNREACRLVLDFYGRLAELRSLPGVAPSCGLKPLP